MTSSPTSATSSGYTPGVRIGTVGSVGDPVRPNVTFTAPSASRWRVASRQVQGLDPVPEPLARDRAVEGGGRRHRVVEPEADHELLIHRESIGRDGEAQGGVARDRHPRRLLDERERAIERGRRRGRATTGTSAPTSNDDHDDRASGADHSDRPSTHSPTGSGWKPARSVERVRAVVVGLGIHEGVERATVAQPVQAVDEERAAETAAVRVGVDREPLHVAVGRSQAEQPVPECCSPPVTRRCALGVARAAWRSASSSSCQKSSNAA